MFKFKLLIFSFIIFILLIILLITINDIINISNLNIYNNESIIDYYNYDNREKFNEIINFRYISKLY